MNILKEILRIKFEVSTDTKLAFALGIAVICCSFTLTLFQKGTIADDIFSFIMLDIVIKVILGFYIPIYYMIIKKKKGLEFFGVKKDKWLVSFILGLIFTGGLFFKFSNELGDREPTILFRKENFIAFYYILVAGFFEMVFIYGFLRKVFEQSFGVIPGIILTALFYSYYHAGFQPEFGKLVFVGILYASVFRLTNNLLIIFPFFWGIGALWDVLVNFGTTELAGIDIFLKASATLFLMIISMRYCWKNASPPSF